MGGEFPTGTDLKLLEVQGTGVGGLHRAISVVVWVEDDDWVRSEFEDLND